jgi:hypothetical protein
MEAQGVAMMMRGRFCNTHMRGGYALINVKRWSAKYIIMCIKVGECRYCSWTIYYQILIPTYGYMQM